jgi:hypothetical protein
VVPLAIAGFAESRTYESGYDNRAETEKAFVMADEVYGSARMSMAAPAQNSVAGGTMQTASGSASGDQFEFTLKNLVSLERRQSAMLPLVESVIKAEKLLVFSGLRLQDGVTRNPAISAELTNSSGMKLPAGPVTVYDGGTYSGDALIAFFPEDERRLISYGDDLSVTGSTSSSGTRYVTTVNVSGGIMTITRRQSYEKTYTIRNASAEAKKLIVEHPLTQGAELVEPANADERTANLYRFDQSLPAKGVLTFKVKEEIPLSERITLAQLRPDIFLSYTTNQEIPANVRTALAKAVGLKRIADDAVSNQAELQSQLSRLVLEQDRIRRNLEAAGNQSPQGQDYLKRLASLDGEIDSLNALINEAAKEVHRVKKEYDDYLAELSI